MILCREKSTETLYAIKMLKKDVVIQKDEVEHTLTENRVLRSTKHPFIIVSQNCSLSRLLCYSNQKSGTRFLSFLSFSFNFNKKSNPILFIFTNLVAEIFVPNIASIVSCDAICKRRRAIFPLEPGACIYRRSNSFLWSGNHLRIGIFTLAGHHLS